MKSGIPGRSWRHSRPLLAAFPAAPGGIPGRSWRFLLPRPSSSPGASISIWDNNAGIGHCPNLVGPFFETLAKVLLHRLLLHPSPLAMSPKQLSLFGCPFGCALSHAKDFGRFRRERISALFPARPSPPVRPVCRILEPTTPPHPSAPAIRLLDPQGGSRFARNGERLGQAHGQDIRGRSHRRQPLPGRRACAPRGRLRSKPCMLASSRESRLVCPRCSSKMRILAVIIMPEIVSST